MIQICLKITEFEKNLIQNPIFESESIQGSGRMRHVVESGAKGPQCGLHADLNKNTQTKTMLIKIRKTDMNTNATLCRSNTNTKK